MLKVCEICEAVEACVEVKHYEDGEFRELSLCAACAQKNGLSLPDNLADLLLESTLEEVAFASKDMDVSGDSSRQCPVCHMKLADFRKTGRLGCAACYATWEKELEPMLLGMHRSLQYKGNMLAGNTPNVEGLQDALLRAVAEEDYEGAARLRDRIRRMRNVLGVEEQGEFHFDESR